MKYAKIKVNGKDTKIAYSITKSELEDQVYEIFHEGHYKDAKIKDGIIFDVGANSGLASLYFAETAKMVYAFEPNPEIFEALKENTKGHKNIKIFNKGISYMKQKLPLFAAKEGDQPQTMYVTEADMKMLMCDFTTIEQVMEDENIKHIDALKIDVEGAEYLIFPDESFKRIADKIDVIVGEGHYVIKLGLFPQLIPLMLEEY